MPVTPAQWKRCSRWVGSREGSRYRRSTEQYIYLHAESHFQGHCSPSSRPEISESHQESERRSHWGDRYQTCLASRGRQTNPAHVIADYGRLRSFS
jgi:hypothetical protein